MSLIQLVSVTKKSFNVLLQNETEKWTMYWKQNVPLALKRTFLDKSNLIYNDATLVELIPVRARFFRDINLNEVGFKERIDIWYNSSNGLLMGEIRHNPFPHHYDEWELDCFFQNSEKMPLPFILRPKQSLDGVYTTGKTGEIPLETTVTRDSENEMVVSPLLFPFENEIRDREVFQITADDGHTIEGSLNLGIIRVKLVIRNRSFETVTATGNLFVKYENRRPVIAGSFVFHNQT